MLSVAAWQTGCSFFEVNLVRWSVLPALGPETQFQVLGLGGFPVGPLCPGGEGGGALGRVGVARRPFYVITSPLGVWLWGRVRVACVPFEAGERGSCAVAHRFPFPQNATWRCSAGKTAAVWEASTGNRVVEVSPSPAKSALSQKEPS